MFAERRDELLLVATDVVEVDMCETELAIVPQPFKVTREVGGDAHIPVQVLRSHQGRGGVELLNRA
ncbi:hypothetical protein D3C83_171590 [compost metagenome]